MTPLISVQDLMQLLASGRPCVLLDCGFDLNDTAAGERTYAECHLPGAYYAHLDRDLSAPKTGRNGRHPLPSREVFARTVARWGVRPGVPVIAYDEQGGPYAARAWWMLRWLGHTEAAVLDGGAGAWMRAGGALEEAVPALHDAPPYPLAASSMPTMDTATVAASLGRAMLLDARAADRFRGDVEPFDPVAGHIPGAINRHFMRNLDALGLFREPAELRREYEALGTPPSQVVHQCGSGVTACHNLLAMEVAGLHGSALHAGSWSEWCADPARPVARG